MIIYWIPVMSILNNRNSKVLFHQNFYGSISHFLHRYYNYICQNIYLTAIWPTHLNFSSRRPPDSWRLTPPYKLTCIVGLQGELVLFLRRNQWYWHMCQTIFGSRPWFFSVSSFPKPHIDWWISGIVSYFPLRYLSL